MGQSTIYNLYIHLKELGVFLGIVLFLGGLIYIFTHKFDIHKKRMMYLGLLTGFNKHEILSLCSILIRLFGIIYSACVYTEYVLLSLAIILVIDIIYIILNPKKIFFETINIGAQLVFLYLVYILRTYQLEVSHDMYIDQVVIILVVFIIIYAIYFFLKGFEDLVHHNNIGKIKK